MLAGAALWGLHMGLTQGLLAALVAAAAPADLRGTAFGVFNLVCGIALLVASVLAGWLWDASARVHVLRGRGVHADRVDRAVAPRRAGDGTAPILDGSLLQRQGRRSQPASIT